ncbi:MAG TPA: sulfatase, partial [Kiritimatiellia bacterium]|nr:sulfatase [Kiritimatiellia bacterium]
ILPLLTAETGGLIDPSRTAVITGRERHVAEARDACLPYPMRALHTADFLYIRNFAPERWPMGAPFAAEAPLDTLSVEELEHNTRYAFPDLDASPTKAWVVLNRESESGRRHYALAFAKRPAEELYDLRKDRDQLNNVVADPAYAAARARMADDLTARLKAAGDPRVCQNPIPFEQPPFTDPPAKKAPKRPVGAPLAPR